VVDNLSRALENVPEGAREEGGVAMKALVEGVELTHREMQAVLARHGVKKLEPEGEKFDPNFHQAMFEAPNDSVPSGMVSQVVQSGWKIGDRVLRPALVGVSKGPARV
jgi:molecular chaperone GrpE